MYAHPDVGAVGEAVVETAEETEVAEMAVGESLRTIVHQWRKEIYYNRAENFYALIHNRTTDKR